MTLLRCGRLASALFVLILIGASAARSQSLDELHKAALKEGGTINFYASLAQINAEKILPEGILHICRIIDEKAKDTYSSINNGWQNNDQNTGMSACRRTHKILI